MTVGRRRPLASPRTAFRPGQHIAHLGVHFGALNFCAGGPRVDQCPLSRHASFALHVHARQGKFRTQTTIPNKPPLIPDHKILLQRHVEKQVLVAIVFFLTKLAVTHDNHVPTILTTLCLLTWLNSV